MDWVRTTHEACPFCEYEATAVPRSEIPEEFGRLAGDWSDALAVGPEVTIRGTGWSALEYGCHTRDVLLIFGGRIHAVTTGESIGWWDHEQAAIDERYNEQDPAIVGAALVSAAAEIGERCAAIKEGEWQLSGERRPGEVFTVDALLRFALHETNHHLGDARSVLDSYSAHPARQCST
jgi:hypothetical protein